MLKLAFDRMDAFIVIECQQKCRQRRLRRVTVFMKLTQNVHKKTDHSNSHTPASRIARNDAERMYFLDLFSLSVCFQHKGCQLKSYPLFHWENSVYLILRSFKSIIFYHVPKETSNFWYFFQINFVMNHLFPETRSFQSKYFNKM